MPACAKCGAFMKTSQLGALEGRWREDRAGVGGGTAQFSVDIGDHLSMAVSNGHRNAWDVPLLLHSFSQRLNGFKSKW
jgi:hypothetical protein